MTSLRERLSDPRILVAVGAHDGLTATLAERAGLEAVYQGGYAVAAHHHGLPDIGLVGLSDVAESLRRITAVSKIPVIVDADTGYGSEPGVRRSVLELERAGAAAVQIEDQVFPKRCGHMEGKSVIPREDMVLKVRAAVEARRNPDTVIIARTDALQMNGLDDAIDRCNAYREAGADVTFVDAPRSREHLEEISRRVDGPEAVQYVRDGAYTPAHRRRAAGARLLDRDLPQHPDLAVCPRVPGAPRRAGGDRDQPGDARADDALRRRQRAARPLALAVLT